jgi:hypothetical protein
MVRGTVINAMGNETGVTVNGKLAMVFGTEFVANHIPLEEGANTIEVVATDTEGNTVTTTVVVNGVIANQYINLTANTESGISPLEVVLTINSSLDLSNASLTYTGPGQAEFLSTSLSEYTVKLTAEGIYYFTISINSGGMLYQDSMGIEVLSEAELDSLLRSKWGGMKGALANQNVDEALNYFAEESRQLFSEVFAALYTQLPQIAQEMQDIQLIYSKNNTSKYRIRKTESYGGQMLTITYYIYFIVDRDGIWRIYRF